LHISLHDAVSKVDVWVSDELFQNIARKIFNAAEIKDYWDKNFSRIVYHQIFKGMKASGVPQTRGGD